MLVSILVGSTLGPKKERKTYMETLQEQWDVDVQQENFSMLVAARVNEILSGEALVLDFKPIGGIHYSQEQRQLMFADKIAQAVCANLDRKDK